MCLVLLHNLVLLGQYQGRQYRKWLPHLHWNKKTNIEHFSRNIASLQFTHKRMQQSFFWIVQAICVVSLLVSKSVGQVTVTEMSQVSYLEADVNFRTVHIIGTCT